MNDISFEKYHLSAEINKALALLKYQMPTEVQRKAIPLALEKKDLVVK